MLYTSDIAYTFLKINMLKYGDKEFKKYIRKWEHLCKNILFINKIK